MTLNEMREMQLAETERHNKAQEMQAKRGLIWDTIGNVLTANITGLLRGPISNATKNLASPISKPLSKAQRTTYVQHTHTHINSGGKRK